MLLRPSQGARKFLAGGALTTAVILGLLLGTTFLLAQNDEIFETGVGADMPAFTSTSPDRWLNSEPLTKASLRGNVVLLEIWTSI